jgi:serine protease Do
MNRGTVIGALGGLAAGVSIGAIALAAPSFAHLSQGSTVAPMAAQLGSQAVAGQQARWGTLPNLADLVETVSPAVVQIQVRQASPIRQMSGPQANPFAGTPFQDYFKFNPEGEGGEAPDRRGSGSGFFIAGGYIVTNNHVVEDAKSLTVVLQDGRELTGTVVGTDPRTDLAVVKVDGSSLPKGLSWGDSGRARPGDNVFAIGAPFGLANTVTAGIVSARGRDIRSGQYDDYIQVDAPINQGNSGGPLFDQSGAVIGVNSAIYSPSGGNVGIGFSIPSELASGIVQQIIDNGSVQRGWLGVAISPVTPEIAASLNVPAKGAVVNNVTADSPAAKAGLREGDIILRFGDREVNHVQDLTRAVADTKAGTGRDMRFIRDGREQTVKVTIAKLDDTATPKPVAANTAPSDTGGMSLAELGLGLASREGAVVITSVGVNSHAADVGIRTGDRIVKVGQDAVSTPEAVRKAVDAARKLGRTAVLLQVERDGQRFFAGIPIED